MEMIETEIPKDRVVSVHPWLAERDSAGFARDARQEEFDRLVVSSDCELLCSIPVLLRRAFAGTLFGKGQVANIAEKVKEHEAAVVFVDHQLSPVQQRNLEKAWGAKVVDRTGLILEIFAARARTREGVLQVELASLRYQISRLVRSWTHLERQRGGFGFMGGPGERQIELDRRMIRTRIRSLESDLAHVRRMRATQRAGRRRKDLPTVALVGYTNAGKSTLFNRLTEADVHAADQLFATLDPTLRMVELKDGGRLMLSDTVGFVQDLPHELVDAFRATLEEVVEADLILHVRDASDPEVAMHGQVIKETLAQLGLDHADAPPIVEVWNKADIVPQLISHVVPEVAGSRVALSALDGRGVPELLELLKEWLELDMEELQLAIPATEGKLLAYCHSHGHVLSQKMNGETVELALRIPAKDAAPLQGFKKGLSRNSGKEL